MNIPLDKGNDIPEYAYSSTENLVSPPCSFDLLMPRDSIYLFCEEDCILEELMVAGRTESGTIIVYRYKGNWEKWFMIPCLSVEGERSYRTEEYYNDHGEKKVRKLIAYTDIYDAIKKGEKEAKERKKLLYL